MKSKICIICSFLILFNLLSKVEIKAQDSTSFKRLNNSGYISNIQSIIVYKDVEEWLKENTLHNRLNMNLNVSKKVALDVQLRNRFVYGDLQENDPSYPATFSDDKGIVDLSVNWHKGKSYLINTQLDRAYLSIKQPKYSITAGRQRINWGQTFVWNPNDLFNTYSYFDFDYPERPGSDALRLEYFTGYASGFEIAVKADSAGSITGAALIKLNKWNYDVQFMGGIYESNELVIGAGWSGSISNVGFYGEVSYLQGIRPENTSKTYFFSSFAANYITNSSLNIQAEFLFAHQPDGYSYSSLTDALNRPLNLKTLAFSKYSLFGAIGYPITPLFNGNISYMWMPDIHAHYAGPNITYSLGNNLDTSLIIQYFRAKFKDQILSNVLTQTFTIAVLRVKLSF